MAIELTYAETGDISTRTVLHEDRQIAWKERKSGHVLIHALSTFHFDLDDVYRTFTNPHLPESSLTQAVWSIRYPTAAAFYDCIVDTKFKPPLPFMHRAFDCQLSKLI
ncbi:hypothetical protein C8J56DRAFT_1038513 [Mycena floridula]|nr:hypothetical protein C8J56DRAFT_1038513 [Mycena floridula]